MSRPGLLIPRSRKWIPTHAQILLEGSLYFQALTVPAAKIPLYPKTPIETHAVSQARYVVAQMVGAILAGATLAREYYFVLCESYVLGGIEGLAMMNTRLIDTRGKFLIRIIYLRRKHRLNALHIMHAWS